MTFKLIKIVFTYMFAHVSIHCCAISIAELGMAHDFAQYCTVIWHPYYILCLTRLINRVNSRGGTFICLVISLNIEMEHSDPYLQFRSTQKTAATWLTHYQCIRKHVLSCFPTLTSNNFRRISLGSFWSFLMRSTQQEIVCLGCVHTVGNTPCGLGDRAARVQRV